MMAANMRLNKRLGRVKNRLLTIAMNAGEEGGIMLAAYDLLRHRDYDDTHYGNNPQMETRYPDIRHALRRFIDRGEPQAYAYLGFCAKLEWEDHQRRGTWQPSQKVYLSRTAMQSLQKAAAIRMALAMSLLGTIYYEGKLVPQDGYLARLWWEEGHKYGSASATWSLAFHLGPLAPVRGILPVKKKQAREYIEENIYSTPWLAARAAQWYYLRPWTERETHRRFWGNAADQKKAAIYYAWSGRQGMTEGKFRWAEMLLFDEANLNSGLEMVEGYWKDRAVRRERLRDIVQDNNPDDDDIEALDAISDSGVQDDGTLAWPPKFDHEGKGLAEPKDRPSTRIEKIEGAIQLIESKRIPNRHKAEREGIYALAYRLLREAREGKPALPTREDEELLGKQARRGRAVARGEFEVEEAPFDRTFPLSKLADPMY
ncbi:hypothetical protein CALVIDRAFT_189859 [Calocera viscosa TUFC12733]|uniref:HCP-like protein n=1 Tax=Calocera viscosa (strain TUFC12733) TaxID=1330018 RepID=A0A167KW00_CALVF|nr:hypothetical protein CALVIDRAFT_189859 [Calocera viscosa TUFC12733]